MPLLNYSQVRPWAKAIKDEVLNRRMPPSAAIKGFGDIVNDGSLTQEEIQRIAEWVEGGAPEGDPAYLPNLPNSPKERDLRGRMYRADQKPVLTATMTLLGIRPLTSVVGGMKVIARLPDGRREPLLWVLNYHQEYPRTFRYRKPLRLPARTEIEIEPSTPVALIIAARPQGR